MRLDTRLIRGARRRVGRAVRRTRAESTRIARRLGTTPEPSRPPAVRPQTAPAATTSAAGWCPACEHVVAEWLPGPGGRPHASCGTCWSLERHRFLASVLHGMRPYVSTMSAVLECAPQVQIQRVLRSLAPDATYVGTDLFDLRFASVAADGCALPFDDDSFDMILSFHVLEHIPDDAAAMRELRRVLKPGGILVVQVPRRAGVATEEDVDASPEEKTRRFGQSDHVRYYGDDFEDRLEAAGLRTTPFEASSFLSDDELERFNVPANNPLWICRPMSDSASGPA